MNALIRPSDQRHQQELAEGGVNELDAGQYRQDDERHRVDKNAHQEDAPVE